MTSQVQCMSVYRKKSGNSACNSVPTSELHSLKENSYQSENFIILLMLSRAAESRIRVPRRPTHIAGGMRDLTVNVMFHQVVFMISN